MAANLTLDLSKKKELVTGLMLDKGVRVIPSLRVDLALDVSYSMKRHIENDNLQLSVNQVMGVAVTVDDDGDVDVRKFDDRCEYVGVATVDNHTNFVKKHGILPRGSTRYAPIGSSVIDHHFGGAEVVEVEPAKKGFFGFGGKPAVTKVVASGGPINTMPVLSMILTDGDCQDPDQIDRVLRDAQKYNVYWHFVGIGDAGFPTIKKLADKYPNVGDVYLRDFGMSDKEVYDQIICDELVDWVKRFEQPARANG